MVKYKIGKIIEPARCNIRDHERRTAKALANNGMTVEFILVSEADFTKSPDVMIDGVKWEIKSPQTDKIAQIEKNLKKANRQSPNIIIDSQRIKCIQDNTLRKYLVERFKSRPSIKRLIFVNRRREVVDISRLV